MHAELCLLCTCACLTPQSDARELASFTPSFLWLLRDFYLRLEDEHGQQVRAHGLFSQTWGCQDQQQ
jgi:hypothetical protein